MKNFMLMEDYPNLNEKKIIQILMKDLMLMEDYPNLNERFDVNERLSES